MKRTVNLIVAGAILLALLGYMVTFTVRFNETAIVTTLGRVGPGSVVNAPDQTGSPGDQAGLHFKWPWPISRVARKYDTRLQVLENVLEQQQLADNQTITVNTYVAWRISDPLKFYQRVSTTAEAREALNLRIQDARGSFGKYTFDQLTSSDPQQLRLEDLEQDIKNRVQEDLASMDIGIVIEDVGINRLMLPARVSEVVAERMRAERARLAASYRSRGDEESQTLREGAQTQAQLIETFADAAARQIIAEGRQRAGEIMARFAEDEEFAIYLQQLQALEQILGRRTTFVLDTSMPPFDLLRQQQPESLPVPGATPTAGTQDAAAQDRDQAQALPND